MKQRLIDFYLDWVNNYLTLERMSECSGFDMGECESLIAMGRKYHELNVERLKQNSNSINYETRNTNYF